MRRLLGNRGETLVETLFAILIIMLAGIGFVGMARAGVTISARAAAANEAIYDPAAESVLRPGKVTVSAGGLRAVFDVTITERAGITSFAPVPGTEGAAP